MDHLDDMPEPPPIDYDNFQSLEDLFDDAPAPFPGIAHGDRVLPKDEYRVPDDGDSVADLSVQRQDGLQASQETAPEDEGWRWHDARLIGVERDAEEGTRYEIGCIDLNANTNTGYLRGQYLSVAAFSDVDVAAAFYHDLQSQVDRDGLTHTEVPAFAAQMAGQITGTAPEWQLATTDEYKAYEHLRDRENEGIAGRDEPPEQAVDSLLLTALELGEVMEHELNTPIPGIQEQLAFKALTAIGIEAQDFDPAKEPPPFYDAETGTAYWVGVFQPDPADHQHCVTSILSLGRNPETDELEAQLAPCVPGDWDKAYSAAEYLIGVAQKGGINRCFDAAEGMALATDQRALWETPLGVTLEQDAAQEIADYTRDQWEVDL